MFLLDFFVENIVNFISEIIFLFRGVVERRGMCLIMVEFLVFVILSVGCRVFFILRFIVI